MRKINRHGILLAGLAALAIVAAPVAAWAGTPGGANNKGADATTCKSGKKVQNAKFCKENGGKN